MAACSQPTETADQPITQNTFAVIQSLDDCEPYHSLLALEERYLGLYLGEIHGSMNAPEILECFILSNTDRERALVISLEMFHDDQARLSEQSIASGAKGLGTGTPPIHQLIAHYQSIGASVQFHYHDGYYTGYAYASEITPKPAPIGINGQPTAEKNQYEAWSPVPNARERSIGDAIKREIYENRFIVALGGNIHASRATWSEDWGEEGRAGSYLPRSIATIMLQASQGGELRVCTSECGLLAIPARNFGFSEGRALIPGDQFNYDFLFDVGQWRPIPPPPL